MSGNSIPLSYTVHTGPVIPLSQCGNERKVFIFQFQSGITSNKKQTNKQTNKKTQPTKDHEWKLSATKRVLPVPPESCNSQMVCPFFFSSPPFCPYYTLGIWHYGSTEGIIAFSQRHERGL